MKTKLMFAALAAAAVFTACNKETPAPQVQEVGTKSIVLNIANLQQTKADSQGTEATVGANQVVLNNYQVFFADNSGNFYTPKDATAENDAPTYFTYVADNDAPVNPDAVQQFHFLDKNVSKVIVLGNIGDTPISATNVDELWAKYNNIAISAQQEQDDLILYGSDFDITDTAPNHYVTEDGNATNDATGTDQHPSPVYLAKVKLMPAVARFEVVGYEYAQAPEMTEKKDEAGNTVYEPTGNLLPREYSQITVTSQSLIGFYENAAIRSEGAANWAVTPANGHVLGWNATGTGNPTIYNWNNIYQEYFTKLTPADKGEWYYDTVADVTLTDEAPAVALASIPEPEEGKPTPTTYSGNCYAYHVFPTQVPSFIFQLTALEDGVTSLLYLQTKRISGIEDNKLEAGKIYQMNVKFDDTVLRAAEKCIDVEITVHDWVVTVVTPEF